MKALMILRKWNDDEGVGETVRKIKENLEKNGWKVDTLSRINDLHMDSLSSSMGTLKEAIRKKDQEENYDVIYTHDWSIAFPLLIPEKVFVEKHYCFFHDIQPGGKSKVFQRIVGNMLGKKLLVKTEALKKKFPKATLSPDGMIKFTGSE